MPANLVLITALILTSLSSSSPDSFGDDVISVKKPTSSAVFPIYGDVYPHGLYYVSMSIGDPPRPYFLDVDTGSDLTWLQCDAPCVRCTKGPHPFYRPKKNNVVPCKDPLCGFVRASTHQNPECESLNQCDYEINYADHLSSLGVLVSDSVVLRLTNGSLVHPRLGFGCGYDQQGSEANSASPTDGVLGLGSGRASIMSQLRYQGVIRNVIGHCLSSRGGGYLFFGDDLVPPSIMTWALMFRSAFQNYYSPGKASFFLGKHSLSAKEQQPVVLDSGSSYTYFRNQLYEAFLATVKNGVYKTPLKAVEDPSLPMCWKGAKPFKSPLDANKYFETLVVSFAKGRKAAQMEIPPENYLIITKYGNICLGILNGTEIGLKDLNVIGDISMQDTMVVYDNEKQQIGWARVNCDRLPNDEDYTDGFEGSLSGPRFASLVSSEKGGRLQI